MRILLLLLCTGFSGIYFIFSKLFQSEKTIESLFFSPFFGSVFFLLLGVFLFFYFSKTKPIIDSQYTSDSYINTQQLQIIIRKFFSQHLYYMGIVFFYAAFYFIFLGLGTIEYFSYFIFLLNVGVLILTLSVRKLYIIQDLLKINTIVFSLLYIGYYIVLIFSHTSSFSFISFINSLLIFALFLVFLGFKDPAKKSYVNDPIVTGYFSFYTIVASVFYGNFLSYSPVFTSAVVTCLLGIIIFYTPQWIRFFNTSTTTLRSIGVLSVCTSLLFIVSYILQEGIGFLSVLLILIIVTFTYKIHILYQNYFSLFFSFLGVFFLFSYIYLSFVYIGEQKNILFLLNYILISQAFIIYTYLYDFQYMYDIFCIHIFSYIVNIFGVSLFLFFTGLDILNIGMILLFESIFIFSSYYKLNKL